jgi:hypothetical protein
LSLFFLGVSSGSGEGPGVVCFDRGGVGSAGSVNDPEVLRPFDFLLAVCFSFSFPFSFSASFSFRPASVVKDAGVLFLGGGFLPGGALLGVPVALGGMIADVLVSDAVWVFCWYR